MKFLPVLYYDLESYPLTEQSLVFAINIAFSKNILNEV